MKRFFYLFLFFLFLTAAPFATAARLHGKARVAAFDSSPETALAPQKETPSLSFSQETPSPVDEQPSPDPQPSDTATLTITQTETVDEPTPTPALPTPAAPVLYVMPTPSTSATPTPTPSSIPETLTGKTTAKTDVADPTPTLPEKAYPAATLFHTKPEEYYPQDGLPKDQKNALLLGSLISFLFGSAVLSAPKLAFLKEVIKRLGMFFPYSLSS